MGETPGRICSTTRRRSYRTTNCGCQKGRREESRPRPYPRCEPDPAPRRQGTGPSCAPRPNHHRRFSRRRDWPRHYHSRGQLAGPRAPSAPTGARRAMRTKWRPGKIRERILAGPAEQRPKFQSRLSRRRSPRPGARAVRGSPARKVIRARRLNQSCSTV